MSIGPGVYLIDSLCNIRNAFVGNDLNLQSLICASGIDPAGSRQRATHWMRACYTPVGSDSIFICRTSRELDNVRICVHLFLILG